MVNGYGLVLLGPGCHHVALDLCMTTVWIVSIQTDSQFERTEKEIVHVDMTEEGAKHFLRTNKFLKSQNYPWLWHRGTERGELWEKPLHGKEPLKTSRNIRSNRGNKP